MWKLFKLLFLAALVLGGWYVWKNYDLPGWYRHVNAALKIGDTRGALILPKKNGEQFEKQNLILITNECEFSPSKIEIKAGQYVIWYNQSDIEQMIMGDDFDVKFIRPKKSFIKGFGSPGTYRFDCTQEDNKKGEIIVR